MWQDVQDWLGEHQEWLFWLGGLSLASLVLTAILLPVVIVRLPADYFVRPQEAAPPRSPGRRVWHVVKNLLGGLFVLAGLAMLLLPGQGLLTIAIGLLLIDLPGKRSLERRLIGRPSILRLVNNLRRRRGRPPLQLDAPPAQDASGQRAESDLRR